MSTERDDLGSAGTATRDARLISIVLPVSGVQDYLGACLDSVLGQQAAGIEVIAVDDASSDGCGAILDERAARDPRLRVIHLPQRVGPGPARNAGLAEASGRYVWFVDPDDLLAAGSLAVVAARLERDHPDVLLADYLILHPSGRTDPSPGHELLTAPPAPAITLADRPALVNRTMTAWSKVMRRRFLCGLGVSFPPGIHEDIPVSCAVLLAAERIALLDEVCYLYRQREKSFLATPGMAHVSVFASYGSVFALMERHPGWPGVTSQVRAAVFGRAMEHYTAVLASGLIPRQLRREYFRRVVADARRYRPPGYAPPPGPRGIKHRLIARNAYRAYTVLEPLNRARVGLRRWLPSRCQAAGSL